jgi:hypothetical protein
MAATTFRFDGKNARAQKVAARQAGRLIRGVSDETIAAVRSVIRRSIAEGIPPYDAARMIRSVVGLTERQAQAAMSYRAELVNSGLTLAKVDKLVERYAEKKIAERAETIARTEILDALNDGALEGWAQAKAEGLLGDGATKEAIVYDDGTCTQDICPPLEGVAIPLDQEFQTVAGPFMAPPFHPRCRCTLAVNP